MRAAGTPLRHAGRLIAMISMLAALAGCSVLPAGMPAGAITTAGDLPGPRVAAQNFVHVVERVRPVAEEVCIRYTGTSRGCQIDIAVDPRPALEPNAFQMQDQRGRPLIVFTLSLIADARNEDELAFVLGHESAHQILGHIARRQSDARHGAELGAVIGEASGLDAATIAELSRMGAEIAARRYSKDFELEADALGAEIALRAGYDPIVGTAFFTRLPDPGDQFMGSHPPNTLRRQQVAEVVARLTGGPVAPLDPMRAGDGTAGF